MGDLTKNFSRHEFRCHCGCGGDHIDYETLTVLQELRDALGYPVRVESGYRCKSWNKEIGGKKNSWHLTGRAVDFKVYGVEVGLVQTYLRTKYPDKFGIGSYAAFTHLDTRQIKARWRDDA